ncbi:decarboxylating 6-phosphogluconate dehydrogenase [Candidatus Daviesbacteria bacterium]|nr:decarboxylating 6-phosphogluconate dehydrogenase [Candidatus Daviesbacteria bacterium]
MKIGFIGLGRMGKNIVLNLLEHGITVVAWNRSPQPREELKQEASQLKSGSENLTISETTDELVKSLGTLRVIWLMVSADAMDTVLGDLTPKLSEGDLIIDGGNSFYQETLRRAKELSEKGIHFMDVGISGGVEGARHGACMMAGGSKEDFEKTEPVLRAEAAPGAYGHLGPVGAGHFAKMVHNGIEYGMMEAIGEGAAILKYSDFNFDLKEVFRVYNNKSIIDSRLVDWTLKELNEDPDLKTISSVIGSAGGAGKGKAEAHWTIEIADKMGIDVPVIKAALAVRENSDKDKEDSPSGFRNKVVAAMRWQFGRHPVKKS